MRSSQINGCAYCLDLHVKDALKVGEKQQRINVLSAWREVSFFTPEEQAILQLTEELTLINQHHGVSDSTYNKAKGITVAIPFIIPIIIFICLLLSFLFSSFFLELTEEITF